MAPGFAPATAACVLVGMGGFFAGVAKVPIASLIMVAEMSGSYNLLVPLMLVSSVCFLLMRGVSIYEAQVPTRIDSPAHVGELQMDVLEKLTVREVLDTDAELITMAPGTPFEQILETVAETEQHAFPLVDKNGVVVGLFSATDVRRMMASPDVWSVLVASDLAVSANTMAYLELDDDLHTAVRRFTAFRHENLPVLAGPPPSRPEGMLSYQRVLEVYDEEIQRLQSENEDVKV
jgi:CIC family chloride channel protein